ncbi:MAG: SusC/RagA family TonB-linked outer membrane protein [Balneolales bacterium]
MLRKNLQRIAGMLSLVCAFSVVQAQAQERQISGTVTAADNGEPLPGVNVAIRGTTQGTTTDVDGEYQISITENSQELRFSMVGFTTIDETVGDRSVIDVALSEAALELDDMVVTAFGMERERRSLGYSTQSVGTQDLSEALETNVVNSLRGRISGVEISQSPTAGGSSGILIRGVGSITGDNMPLIVVDGIPIDNQSSSGGAGWGGIDYGDGIGGVSATNIEDLTVLKGPNAAALYGARASNGVIVITTKSGHERDGIGVSVNSNVTFDQIGMKPQFQNKYGTGYSMNYDDAYGNGLYEGETYPNYTGSLDQHGPPLDGTLILISRMPELGPISATPQSRDDVYDFYNTGVTANNSIAFSGGDDATTYRLSLTDQRNQGVVPNSEFGSNSAALRVTSQVSDRLLVDGKATYQRHEGINRPSIGSNFQNTFQNLYMMPPFVDLAWLEDYKRPDGTPRNISGGYPMNPYWMINEIQNDDRRNRVYGFISATYDFTDWLNATFRAGTDTYQDQRFRREAVGTRTNRQGMVNNTSFAVQENNYDFTLNAVRDLSADFSSSLILGGNLMQSRTERTTLRGTNLDIPDLYHISNANSVDPQSYLARKEMQSLFALGQLGYRDYVYLDLTARNDWSSTLGLDNQSFFYPSASLAFVFSDAFDIDSPILTHGKLRASWAQTGNDASVYQTLPGYSLNSLDFDGVRMAEVPDQIPLIDLKNELTTSWEFGADIRLFENRLAFDVTAYSSSVENQIFPVSVSGATGYTQRLINAGKMDNQGIEVSVNARPVETQDFMWNLGLNISRNRSEVVELAEGVTSHSIVPDPGIGQAQLEAQPGQPYGDFYSLVQARTEDGRIELEQTGELKTAEDREVIGNMQPDFLGGITNEIRYRGFSLGAVLDYRFGGEIISLTMREGYAKGNGVLTEERSEEMYHEGVIENLYNEDGDLYRASLAEEMDWDIDDFSGAEEAADKTYRENDEPVDPVGYYPARGWGALAENWLVNGSYVSLTEVTLGYALSPSVLEQTPFTGLKFSIVARNLAYLHMNENLRKMGVPPLSQASRDPASMAFEESNFPLLRSVGFNINAQF